VQLAGRESTDNPRVHLEKTTTKNGETRWRAVVRRAGFPTRSKTFPLKRDAETWGTDQERQIARMRGGLGLQTTRALVSDLISQYQTNGQLERDRTTEDSQYVMTLQLDWWRERIGDEAAASIRPKTIRQAIDAHTKRDGTPSAGPTRNRYLAALSSVYRWAIDLELVDRNPVSGVRRYKESDHIVRYLTDEERERLLTATAKRGDEFHALILASLWSGGDRGEMLRLRWRHVHLDRGLIEFPWKRKAKGLPRTVPIPTEATDALRKIGPHHPDARVFNEWSRDHKGPVYKWKAALRDAEITDFRWKDLRHSFCSWLVQRGVPIADVQHLAGHRHIETTLRYAHLAPTSTHDRVRQALEGLNAEGGKVLDFQG